MACNCKKKAQEATEKNEATVKEETTSNEDEPGRYIKTLLSYYNFNSEE